jgi:hypothetical protein
MIALIMKKINIDVLFIGNNYGIRESPFREEWIVAVSAWEMVLTMGMLTLISQWNLWKKNQNYNRFFQR